MKNIRRKKLLAIPAADPNVFGAGHYEANAAYVPESLKTVTVTGEVSLVGPHASEGLAGLEEIELSHSVKTVYEYAFHQTTARYELTNVVAFIRPRGEYESR